MAARGAGQPAAQPKEAKQRGKEARIRPEPHDCRALGEMTLPGWRKISRSKESNAERKPGYTRSPVTAALLARRRSPDAANNAGGVGPDVPKAGRRGGGAPGQHDEAARGSAEGKQRGKEARIRPESHDCHIFGVKAPPEAAKRKRGKPGCP